MCAKKQPESTCISFHDERVRFIQVALVSLAQSEPCAGSRELVAQMLCVVEGFGSELTDVMKACLLRLQSAWLVERSWVYHVVSVVSHSIRACFGCPLHLALDPCWSVWLLFGKACCGP